MANIFTDRVPTRPGRYKITPDSGSAYYATMERADEPTTVGTAINATNLNRLLDRNGDTMLGNLAMGGYRVTGLGTPTATTDAATKAYVDGRKLADFGVTATAAELNTLDGVTATATELNVLDGIKATTTELNYCDGVTSSIQTQLNGKQPIINGGASSIAGTNLTGSRALVSDSGGKVAVSAVTTTELGRLSGVTSSVQTQLNNKAPTIHNHSGYYIEPTYIELKPGENAGHGGYIDFHYNNDSGDWTSRIIDINGTVSLNDNKIMTWANVCATYSNPLSFTDGIATYSSSYITTKSTCIAQIRSSSTGNGQLLTTTSYNGYVQIAGPATLVGTRNVNIIIVNP